MKRATERMVGEIESAVRYTDCELMAFRSQHSKCWAIFNRPLRGLFESPFVRPF